ncbi:similar to Saccharomyces cerevisiae YDL231C BRE4 Zinc finger protein containing five transmembrane domains [Maudiozyma saulgeensis]|uniref:Similar to Saccharomyces cerevisiae YDL231C BRE4 Zinc finger protein containing five transmembrane domains n=1 Tax=Maudiozyma saulgeensis TaxID=1789683 RepID=A0A1X7R7C1_9SACH|nr:similar to Saccharomyces cerevisiae YDL231C BRE4 Zinc finger protein containing five transmembrane domains [Kazachstania saulgeensis]
MQEDNGRFQMYPRNRNGSYRNLSYSAIHDQNRMHGSPRKHRSNINSPQMSEVSLSQLKLDDMTTEKDWNKLDDFHLEELRDGFFDATYTRPKRVISPEDSVGSAKSNQNLKPSKIINNTPAIVKDIYSKSIQDWKQLLKFFLAYLIAMIICVIHPAGKWIGHKYRYFMPISVILHHPARNVGVQLEMTIESCVGLVFGLGWSSLAWYVSTATGPTASHQGGILFQSLVMALWSAIWVKAYYNRLFYLCQSFGITILFTHTVDLVFDASELKWILFRDFALSYVFGILLSLIISAFIFPTNGNAKMIQTLDDTVNSIKGFLMTLVDKGKYNDIEYISSAQKNMTNHLNVKLSLVYRDFLNQFTIFNFKASSLKRLRDSLTVISSPLRVIPIHQRLFDNQLLERLYQEVDDHKHDLEESGEKYDTDAIPSGYITGTFTPVSGVPNLPHHLLSNSTNDFYINILKKKFARNTLHLILEMIIVIDKISQLLQLYKKRRHSKNEIEEAKGNLHHYRMKLQKMIFNVDTSYNNFIESNLFSEDIIKDFECVDIFLFIRYSRSSAKHLLKVLDEAINLDTDSKMRISTPKLSAFRTLHRLPDQCLMDQGLGRSLLYFETKKDVDEIFERSYNSYTSRHVYNRKNDTLPSTRAIDHTDFNFHTTQNSTRFKLWEFTKLLSGREMKWTLKCLICIIFLCLPTWLPESYRWYEEFQCWWAPLMFFILNHNKPAGKMIYLANRLICGIIGMFWGWAACQAHHFGSPYVICVFAGLICIPSAINQLIYKNSKSSNTAMICFTVIALEAFSKNPYTLKTSVIWKNCWTTSLSLIVGIVVSIVINWIFWSYRSRTELRLAVSYLLSHLSQSYQSVAERYLYRDLNDDPTELSLMFSHIREVRLTRSIEAIRQLLGRTKREPIFVSNFNADKYERLINACQNVFERMIEARVSGTYFEIWNQDSNSDATRALLSLRRDSTSSVIYTFYLLSNCFRSRNRIPRYLPSSVTSRRRLFDFMSKFNENIPLSASLKEEQQDNLEKQLFKKLGKLQNKDHNIQHSSSEASSRDEVNEDNEEARWKDIYGVAFARSFTAVCESMDVLIECCKDILGEEYY